MFTNTLTDPNNHRATPERVARIFSGATSITEAYEGDALCYLIQMPGLGEAYLRPSGLSRQENARHLASMWIQGGKFNLVQFL